MPSVLIRTATLDDAEMLRRYGRHLFAEGLPGIFERPEPTIDDEHAFISSRLGPDNSTLIVATSGDEAVGLVDFLGGSYAEDAHAGEFGLSVARAHRGTGIGTALVEALLAWAPRHGVWRVAAQAWSNNPGAIRLYERLGFERECIRRAAIVSRSEVLDVHVMVRILDASVAE